MAETTKGAYLFHVELGDTVFTAYSDRTWVQKFYEDPDDEDKVTSMEAGPWDEWDGEIVVRDDASEGWDRAVDEIQEAYSKWRAKVERVVGKLIVM